MSDEGQTGAASQAPVTVEAAIAASRATPVTESRDFEYSFENAFNKISTESEENWIRLHGLRDHFSHKKKWSWLLMIVIGSMVVFQSFLIWWIGKGWLDFTKYDWLLPTLMIQYLTQIVGLAVFAVKSFFQEMK